MCSQHNMSHATTSQTNTQVTNCKVYSKVKRSQICRHVQLCATIVLKIAAPQMSLCARVCVHKFVCTRLGAGACVPEANYWASLPCVLSQVSCQELLAKHCNHSGVHPLWSTPWPTQLLNALPEKLALVVGSAQRSIVDSPYAKGRQD